MIELFIVALVLEICRQVTLCRLYGRKNHSTRCECCDFELLDKWKFGGLFPICDHHCL